MEIRLPNPYEEEDKIERIIQKYLRMETTREEEQWLLDVCLKTINNLLKMTKEDTKNNNC